jgi:ATP-binding cassette, subfamily C, bacterial LapB
MRELIGRLFSDSRLCTELILATLFVNLLGFASPLFVIQVMNRYITFGFDGTLITLTLGMLLAVAIMFLFRHVRLKMAAFVGEDEDKELADKALDVLSRGKAQAMLSVPAVKKQEMAASLQALQGSFDANTMVIFLDVPFFLLFLAGTALLSPVLAGITLAAILVASVPGYLSLVRGNRDADDLREASAMHRGTALSAMDGAETVRTFGGASFLRDRWNEELARVRAIVGRMAEDKGRQQNRLKVVGILLKVFIFAVGAKLVVQNQLSIGALFGASILGGYAFQNALGFLTVGQALIRASTSRKVLESFSTVPLDEGSGLTLQEYAGGLEFADVGFAWPGSSGPLFESLSFKIPPGGIVVVSGPNGAGKTTMARMIAGLLDPARGQILADGVDLRQLAPEWWRLQLVYLPQDPTFLNGSVRENILMNNPGLEEERLNEIIREAGLRGFLDRSPQGLLTQLSAGGRNLPVGIRRRLALARGLASDGLLVLFDEPAEGLDAEGRMAVFQSLAELSRRKRTILVFSHDPQQIQGAQVHVDLGVKPVPAVRPTGTALRIASKEAAGNA